MGDVEEAKLDAIADKVSEEAIKEHISDAVDEVKEQIEEVKDTAEEAKDAAEVATVATVASAGLSEEDIQRVADKVSEQTAAPIVVAPDPGPEPAPIDDEEPEPIVDDEEPDSKSWLHTKRF
jgi:hypothetical protein